MHPKVIAAGILLGIAGAGVMPATTASLVAGRDVSVEAGPPAATPVECRIDQPTDGSTAEGPLAHAQGEHTHTALVPGVATVSTASHSGSHPTQPTAAAPAPVHAHPAVAAGLPDDHAHTDGGCQPTPEQQAAADKLVADTRAALQRSYATPEQALAAGYRPIGDRLARRVHYVSKEEQRDPRVLDPEHPEGLIYQRTGQGIDVIAAWFIMPRVADEGPRVGGCLTRWHRHTDEDGNPTPEMLHVWIVDTPGGPFA